MHAWRLLTVLWSWCRRYVTRCGLWNHACVSAKMHSRAWTGAVAICVCVCLSHVPPVRWFTVSVLGHMTENRWHSGVTPHPQHTHLKHTHTHTPPLAPWEHTTPALVLKQKRTWLHTNIPHIHHRNRERGEQIDTHTHTFYLSSTRTYTEFALLTNGCGWH